MYDAAEGNYDSPHLLGGGGRRYEKRVTSQFHGEFGVEHVLCETAFLQFDSFQELISNGRKGGGG